MTLSESFAVPESLLGLGFGPFFQEQYQAELNAAASRAAPFAASHLVARVVAEWRREYSLLGADGTLRASLAGRLRHELSASALPCVGDWVLADRDGHSRGRIEHVLPRQGCFTRKVAGARSVAQPVAANVDVAFVVSAFNEPSGNPYAGSHALNPRRIERYLVAARQANARAVVVLNKADLCADPADQVERLSRALAGATVVATSTASGVGLDALRAELGDGRTGVLVGSSGVGKSSLLNALLGRATQDVQQVRASDAHGRHTTTHRELFVLAEGGLLIDTPGMREVALYVDPETPEALPELELEVGQPCRFRDCSHRGEPGCAVLAAVESGELDAARVEHHAQLQRELAHQKARSDARLRQEQARKNRNLTRGLRRFKKGDP
jgi:ribosome biogenesis GTPase